jgi:hypothetical protein
MPEKRFLEGANTYEEVGDLPKPYPPGGNHSPRVRRGGKEVVSVLTVWKAAGNRGPNMQMIV